MNKRMLLAAVAALALPLPAGPDRRPHTRAVARCRAEGRSVAWDITEGLTTEIGQRLAATEAEARARAWAVKKLTALGFQNVHIETYKMPLWVRGEETAEIVGPFPQKLTLAALGNSGSTGPKGIEAEVVYFPTLADLQAAPPEPEGQDRLRQPRDDRDAGRIAIWLLRRRRRAGPRSPRARAPRRS
jgi:hypothetical protein